MSYNIHIYSRSRWKALALSILVCASTLSANDGADAQGTSNTTTGTGTILIYHRFGEDELPSTNTRVEQLDQHIEILSDNETYLVMRIDALLESRAARTLGPQSNVAITVDDAYKSVLTEAWPRLKAAGLSLAVFVATDPVDAGNPNYMSWEDLRHLASEGVYIGHHGAAHAYYLGMSDEEVRADILRASARFEAELGYVPRIFAWPYGEYDERLLQVITSMGFDYALAQYSSPLPRQGSDHHLPRFPINERYGAEDRFRLVTRTLPLDIQHELPHDTVLNDESNPPQFGFTLLHPPENIGALACYPSHLGRAANIEILENRRIEVRFDEPFPPGRNRINCTLPAQSGRWYWTGKLFIVPD